MLPLFFGVVQMLGLMGLLGIPFNPANMIALPLILGMGVEDGVHLVHEYRKQRGRFQLGNSTAMAVMLTSTTTISGFACMIVARHQGLRSLGQILTFGMTTCMIVSLYALPALLRWMTRDRAEFANEADDVLPGPSPVATAVDQASNVFPSSDSGQRRIRPTRVRPADLSHVRDDRAA
jgi:preprotein translocase subunit SecF